MRLATGTAVMRGAAILLGGLIVVGVGRWAPRAASGEQPVRAAPSVLAELQARDRALDAARGDLALVVLQLERADAIIAYSTRYNIVPDLGAAIYDLALAEGVDPALAFRLVQVESNFTATARSPAGAIGYTQILPGTARLYEPGLTTRQLYERETNLRLGFRFLRDLLERHDGAGDPEDRLRLALLAYNRGPARVQQLLDAGHDPQNGYAATVMRGYR
jgi:soluble lytic murein transglycosylase-like protein